MTMLRVFSNENRFMVSTVRSYLESHGVPSLLKNEFASGVMGEIPFFETWPEIWVHAELAEKARSLIEEVNTELPQGQDWQCISCNESNPGTFEFCWHCNTAITKPDA